MSITSLSDSELALRKRVEELENKNVPKGCLTVNLGDLEVALEYTYDEEELEVRNSRRGDQPGASPTCEIQWIWIAGTRVSPEHFDTTLVMDWEDEILEYESERSEK